MPVYFALYCSSLVQQANEWLKLNPGFHGISCEIITLSSPQLKDKHYVFNTEDMTFIGDNATGKIYKGLRLVKLNYILSA